MQEGCCTSFWGQFCSSPPSYSCFLCLSKPLPPHSCLLLFPPCHSIASFPGHVFSFRQQFPFWSPIWPPSTSLALLGSIFMGTYLSDWFPFWSLCLISSLLLPSLFPFHPSSIWLFISPIRPISLRFPSRPWTDFFRGISSLMWALCQTRLWHFIFWVTSSHWKDTSSPKVGFVILKNWWNMHSSHLLDGWRDTCVWRGDCPQARVYMIITWMPNHYERGNGPLGGTHWSLRAFYCLVALILCSCIAGVWVWSSVVKVCFCHSFNKYKNKH